MNQEIAKDQMWYKLGSEFCKFKKYLNCIVYDIICEDFPKSYKISKIFKLLYKKIFVYLASLLDDILQSDYERNILQLKSIPGKPAIINIFYNLYKIEIYNNRLINYNTKIDNTGIDKTFNLRNYTEKYRKNLTTDEKNFVDSFFENFKEYLLKIQFLTNYNSCYNDKLTKLIFKINNYMDKSIYEINNVEIIN